MYSERQGSKSLEGDEKYTVPEGQKIPDWIVNEARLLNDALDKGIVEKVDGSVDFQDEEGLIDIMGDMINVTYFVEMPHEWVPPEERGEKMMSMFKQEVELENGGVGTLADKLVEKRSAVSIAMSTLDDSTAEAIKFLNEKKVPVVAWVVLADDDGYWTNALSVGKTQEKIEEIREWKKKHGLEFDTYGLDLEKPLEVVKSLFERDFFNYIKKWLKFNQEVRDKLGKVGSQERLKLLVDAFEKNQETCEFYISPKKAESILGAGIKPPKDSREIEMVYTSDLPVGLGVSFLLSDDTIPAIGILNAVPGQTPGRYNHEGKASLPSHHTYEETLRDIRQILKKRINVKERVFNLSDLYVFALNGRNVMNQTLRALNEALEELKKEERG